MLRNWLIFHHGTVSFQGLSPGKGPAHAQIILRTEMKPYTSHNWTLVPDPFKVAWEFWSPWGKHMWYGLAMLLSYRMRGSWNINLQWANYWPVVGLFKLSFDCGFFLDNKSLILGRSRWYADKHCFTSALALAFTFSVLLKSWNIFVCVPELTLIKIVLE